jgi:PhnB protein
MGVKPIPDGYHSVIPYLVAEGVDGLIDFLKTAFDGQEILRHRGPEGKTGHAEVRIGDSVVMMGEARAQFKAMPAAIYLYVNDVDATFKRAVAAGAKAMTEPVDHFYGDRSGAVVDHWGNNWWIATHKEDVSAEEMAKRLKAMQK